MPRLTSPEGVTVSVDDDYAETLTASGWKSADKPAEKAPAKRAAPSKSEK